VKVYKIVILGSGAHASELEGYIEDNNCNSKDVHIKIVGYYDDDKEQWGKYKLQAPLLGDLRAYNPKQEEQIILGVNSIKLREELINLYKEKGAKFYTFIHHSCFIYKTATIGEGNILTKNCTIGPNVAIANYNTLNTYCSIGHDSVIGNNNVLCPHTGFSGGTIVKNNNFFSLRSTTNPNVKIGNNNVIASNMLLDKEIKDDTVVFYRFKEKVFILPKE
jgi:acetyltransferase-like isoleucine patch superfamily enzyme